MLWRKLQDVEWKQDGSEIGRHKTQQSNLTYAMKSNSGFLDCKMQLKMYSTRRRRRQNASPRFTGTFLSNNHNFDVGAVDRATFREEVDEIFLHRRQPLTYDCLWRRCPRVALCPVNVIAA